ncbi:MAG: hypothetical protein FRX49_12031 [Trebouxia sp. A1-2]|nr:MAG: hypothetical protein FRX49_12031 [Trebouxia sp. A1-2]
MANNDKDSVRREEKLRGVENWARWSNMTMLDLKEKGYWGIVTGARTIGTTPATIASFDRDSAGAAKIIKGGLNDNLFKNVEGTDNPTDIWNKLKAVCTQIKDVALIPQATTNLISLGQLQQSGISYHDEGTKMTLKKKDRTVASAQRIGNLYILDIINNTAMAVRGRPSFLCAPTKELQLWHRRLAHSGIVRVKHASRITTGMDIAAQDNNETLRSDDESDNDNPNRDKTPVPSYDSPQAAVNVPRLSDLSSAAAAGNGGDPPPPNKPVGLRAQCDEEGTGSESTGEFVVVDTTARKRKGNGVGKQPVRRSKRARRPPLDDASDGDNSCPEWCRGDDNLPARMQQARRRGRAIWAQPNRTLSGGSRCGACVRAGADECFVAQTPVCARCTSLRNPRGQCLAEPPASATPDSGSPGVVAAPAATYGGSGGMGTRPEELVAAMAVLPESTAHALRILNAHQSRRRHENIEFNERRRIEEMGSEASSDGEDGSGTAGEE